MPVAPADFTPDHALTLRLPGECAPMCSDVSAGFAGLSPVPHLAPRMDGAQLEDFA
jgi:hypothetical protein